MPSSSMVELYLYLFRALLGVLRNSLYVYMTNSAGGEGGGPVRVTRARQSGTGLGATICCIFLFIVGPPLLDGSEKTVSPGPVPAVGGPDYETARYKLNSDLLSNLRKEIFFGGGGQC